MAGLGDIYDQTVATGVQGGSFQQSEHLINKPWWNCFGVVVHLYNR
jgi:hypothetical protein